jgi:predicted MFS family arabinose efflux permease
VTGGETPHQRKARARRANHAIAMTPIYLPFALSLFFMTGIRASRVLLSLAALNFGAQPLAVGILAATFSALPMLLSWPAGRLSDRYGARALLMVGAAGAACGMSVPYFLPGLPALYLAAAMNGFSFTFANVSLQNAVGLMSTQQDRARNFANFGLVVALDAFVGPLVAGFSIDHMGYANAFLCLTVVSLVPLGMLVVWGALLPGGTARATHDKTSKHPLTEPGVWRVLATSSVVAAGNDIYQFYVPIYGHGIGLSASAIGIILAAFSIAAFVVRIFLPRALQRLGENKVLAYAFFSGAATLALVPFFTNAAVLALISFCVGLGMGCGQPITMILMFSRSAEGRSAESLGLRMTVNHLTRVVGPVIFGSIGSAFGIFPVFWTTALLFASGGMLARSAKAGTKD